MTDIFTAPATAAAPAAATGSHPVPDANPLLAAALAYAVACHWEVIPGTSVRPGPDGVRCSCGAVRCPLPGAHPVSADWARAQHWSPPADGAEGTEDDADGETWLLRWWSRDPHAAVLLATGYALEVLEVPETVGFLALARLDRTGVATGPVAVSPIGRVSFYVAPGIASRLSAALRRIGYSSVGLDLRGLGPGRFTAAPPSRIGGAGPVLWVRGPDEIGTWLPDAEDLLPALAYACALERRPEL